MYAFVKKLTTPCPAPENKKNIFPLRPEKIKDLLSMLKNKQDT